MLATEREPEGQAKRSKFNKIEYKISYTLVTKNFHQIFFIILDNFSPKATLTAKIIISVCLYALCVFNENLYNLWFVLNVWLFLIVFCRLKISELCEVAGEAW